MTASHDPESTDHHLEELIHQYLVARDAGQTPAEEFLHHHETDADAILEAVAELDELGLGHSDADSRQFGGFDLHEEIGHGGMGIVYRAHQRHPPRTVALKLIRPGLLTPRATARFRREIETLSKLEHRNICPIYDAGEVEGRPYLAMRYVRGETLATRLESLRNARESKRDTSSSRTWIDTTLDLGERLARALHHAHAQGVVHRDVKPGNILIDEDGEPVLLDFGLARALQSDEVTMTEEGQRLGTPAYMAPEQIDGQSVDARTDIYGLAVTLYECLTLERPFTGTREELYRQILEARPPDPRTHNRSVSSELALVLATALEKDPRHRYSSALAFAEDLRRVRLHETPTVTKPGLLKRSYRWCQRNPAAAATLAITTIGLVVTLLLLERSRRAERQNRTLAALQRADEVEREDPMLAARLAAHAMELEANARTIARVQELLYRVRPHEIVRREKTRLSRADWSPDGRFFVVAGPNLPYSLHDRHGERLDAGDMPHTWHEQPPIAWSADSTLLAVAEARTNGPGASPQKPVTGVCIYEVDETGARLVHRIDALATVTQLRWRGPPDTRRLLACSIGPVGTNRFAIHVKDGVYTSEHLSRQPQKGTQMWGAAAWLANDALVAEGSWNTERESRSLAGVHAVDQLDQVLYVDANRGKFVTVSLYGKINLYDDTGTLLTSKQCAIPDARGLVSFAVMAPAGKERLAISFMNGRVQLLEIPSLELAREWAVHEQRTTRCLDWSADGKRLATGNWGGTLQIFDADGNEVERFDGHAREVPWVTLSPDGDQLISTSNGGECRLWQLGTQSDQPQHVGLGWSQLHVDPETRNVYFASENGELHECSPAGVQLRRIPVPAGLTRTCLSSDGRTLIGRAADAKVWTLDLRDAKPPSVHPTLSIAELAVQSPRQFPDGRWLIKKKNNRLRSWDEKSDPPFFLDFDAAVTDFVISDSGTHVAIGTWNGRLLVTDDSGKVVWRARERVPLTRSLRFSPAEDRLLAATNDGYAYLWDLSASKLERRFGPHRSSVFEAVFSPDARRIATVASDGSVRVYDRSKGTLERSFRAHTGGARSVVFASDNRLATSGADGAVRWWYLDVADVRKLLERRNLGELTPQQKAQFPHLFAR